jgi:hypothetical protein
LPLNGKNHCPLCQFNGNLDRIAHPLRDVGLHDKPINDNLHVVGLSLV